MQHTRFWATKLKDTKVNAATEGTAGIVALATDAETVTGTNTTKATTPSNLVAKMSAPGNIGDVIPSPSISALVVDIDGGAIDGTNIGKNADASGEFSHLLINNSIDGAALVTYMASPDPIGDNTPNTGTFTDLKIVDETTATYKLKLASNSDGTALTADHELTFDVNNDDRILDIPADQNFPAVAGTVEASHLISADASGNITGIGGDLSGFDVEVDGVDLPEDGGVIALIDQAVSSSSADGTEHGWTSNIDGTEILRVSMLSDGTGGVDTPIAQITGRIVMNGGQSMKRTYSATDYNPSALTDDFLIVVNNISAARSIVISTEDVQSGSLSNTRDFLIKDEFGMAGTNKITYSLESGLIDGELSGELTNNYEAIYIYCNGLSGSIF